MASDIHKRPAIFLDRLPAGYPASPDGTELQILRKLLSPEEASLFMRLSLVGENAPVLAFRARLPRDRVLVLVLLERMAEKGLISSSGGRLGAGSIR